MFSVPWYWKCGGKGWGFIRCQNLLWFLYIQIYTDTVDMYHLISKTIYCRNVYIYTYIYIYHMYTHTPDMSNQRHWISRWWFWNYPPGNESISHQTAKGKSSTQNSNVPAGRGYVSFQEGSLLEYGWFRTAFRLWTQCEPRSMIRLQSYDHNRIQ